MSEKELILQVSHLQKSFGNHAVLNDIDFEVCKGDVVSIIGASGSGKSTMLRCINLLEEPGGGAILFHGYHGSEGQCAGLSCQGGYGVPEFQPV